MLSVPTHEICTCSKCGTQTWLDAQGRTHRGVMQSTAVKQRHIRMDAQATRAGRSDTGEPSRDSGQREDTHFGDSIFLSTLASMRPPPGEFAPNRMNLSKKHPREPGPMPPEASSSRAKRSRTSKALADQEAGSSARGGLSEAQATLNSVQETLQVKKERFSEIGLLQFKDSPKTLEEDPAPLDMSDPTSQQVDVYSSWLESASAIVRKFDSVAQPALSARRQAVEHALVEETDRLRAVMKSQWDQQKAKAGLYGGVDPAAHAFMPVEVDTGRFFRTLRRQSWIIAALVVVVGLHTLSNLSRNEASLILNLIHVLFNGVLNSPEAQSIFYPTPPSSTRLAENEQSLRRNIPLDVRTATKRLDLEPEYTIYACCPKCFATYGPSDPNGKLYLKHCTYRDTPSDEPCGAALLKPGGENMKDFVPMKPYPLHSLRGWLGRLLSRTGIEDILDKAWKLPAGRKDSWADIMHAPGIRQFRGPNGTLFSEQPHGTYHLVFSLFVDWFNPFGNKSAGKHHSVGAIYMVCLNLPPELRYRTENMFLVGIIPGPKEPQKEQLNHLLRPLVDELLVFWKRGVHLSKTAKRSLGCVVFAAVVPLVCDLPAARKTAGFSGHSANNICSFCNVQKTQLNNLDRSTWTRMSWAEHLRIATAWRDAPDRRTRERIFAETGIRWSELLRLPYWDPTRYTVVDAMHNLYLGELRHHCREVLGIEGGDPLTEKQAAALHTEEQQKEWLAKVESALVMKSKTSIMKARKGYLQAFADLNNVSPKADTKLDYAEALLEWYKNQPEDIQIKVPPPLPWPTSNFKLISDADDIAEHKFIDNSLREEIRADLARTTFPSWMNRPPHNFGSASHGSLKADQWRTVATISITFTLIRKWGSNSASKGLHSLLENWMHLVDAVLAGTSKTMSFEQAQFYDHHMYEYLLSLRELLDEDLLPNHHMALHLRECMELFGPVHAWWTFPFERYNGIIAKLNKNNKPAEMPTTFMRYFCIGANLRSLMSGISWPDNELYRSFQDSFHQVIGDALRGLPGILSESKEVDFSYDESCSEELAPDVYGALLLKVNSSSASPYRSVYGTDPADPQACTLSARAQPVQRVNRAGISFQAAGNPSGRGVSNSYVVCKDPETAERHPAQIQKIFYHVRQQNNAHRLEPFLVVQRYLPLSDQDRVHDLYRIWPGYPGQTYYNQLDGVTRVVCLDEIISHFAGTTYSPEGIGRECLFVFSLERVVKKVVRTCVADTRTWKSTAI